MATEHVPGKPRIGTYVDYFNPKIIFKTGMALGYDGRGEGPYAALVTNNVGNGITALVFYPDWAPLSYRNLAHKGDANDKTENGYWDWQTPIQAARAAKEVASAGSTDGA